MNRRSTSPAQYLLPRLEDVVFVLIERAEEEAAVARSRQWFLSHTGIPFDQVVADLGFTMDEVRDAAKDPAA